MRTNEKSDRRPDQKEKESYVPVAFRWKVIQQIDAGLIDELQACEKYGISIILIRQWRKWTPRGSTFSVRYSHF